MVSIINLASVAAIETVVGAPVHPLRFRGNLYVDGLAGLARVRPARAGARDRRMRGSRWSSASCAAPRPTSIPTPACATLPSPTTLMRTFDHADCGIYARVIEGGEIRPGSKIC